ncbi:MAG: hypothetical protein M3R49_04005 [Chloroflexota bacterium]|nr:hypothetical protein [Chloroflexota bacterium]
MNSFKRFAMAIDPGSMLAATMVGSTLAVADAGRSSGRVDPADLGGIGLALVLAVLTTTCVSCAARGAGLDRSALRGLGEFLGDARVRASARRGWISWSPLA